MVEQGPSTGPHHPIKSRVPKRRAQEGGRAGALKTRATPPVIASARTRAHHQVAVESAVVDDPGAGAGLLLLLGRYAVQGAAAAQQRLEQVVRHLVLAGARAKGKKKRVLR